MEHLLATVMRNAWAVLAALLATGAGLAVLGIDLPAVLLFLLAGLLLMALPGRPARGGAPSDPGPA